MPNHITNFLSIKGDINFTDLYSTLGKDDQGEEWLRVIDFNKIIPTPPHIFHGNLTSAHEEKYGKHNCWYQWNINNWDTKWNAYSCVKHSDKLLQFDTAWTPPIKIYEALSMLHPNITFTIIWKDEGSDAIHRMEYFDGSCQSNKIIDHDPTEYDENEEPILEWEFDKYALEIFNKELQSLGVEV